MDASVCWQMSRLSLSARNWHQAKASHQLTPSSWCRSILSFPLQRPSSSASEASNIRWKSIPAAVKAAHTMPSVTIQVCTTLVPSQSWTLCPNQSLLRPMQACSSFVAAGILTSEPVTYAQLAAYACMYTCIDARVHARLPPAAHRAGRRPQAGPPAFRRLRRVPATRHDVWRRASAGAADRWLHRGA